MNELMENFKRLQKQVDTISDALRLSNSQANAATPVLSSTSFTLTPRASLSAKAASHNDETERGHLQSNARFGANKVEMGHRDVQTQHQNNSGLLSTYKYQAPNPKVDNKSHNLVSRTYPFGSVIPSTARTLTSPNPDLQNTEPTHTSASSNSASAKALFPSLHFSQLATSFSRPPQTKDDVSRSPAASVSTGSLVSRMETVKRKHDDISHGGLSLDAEQQLQKKAKIEELSQTIEVEEQSPKKIKLEEQNEGPESP